MTGPRPPGPTWASLSETLSRLASAGVAPPLIITDGRNAEACALEPAIAVPSPEAHDSTLPVDALTPIPYAVPAQLLAAHIAKQKGLNPDAPRMLQKVTQTL